MGVEEVNEFEDSDSRRFLLLNPLFTWVLSKGNVFVKSTLYLSSNNPPEKEMLVSATSSCFLLFLGGFFDLVDGLS